jgi:Uma2 family endonuclease
MLVDGEGAMAVAAEVARRRFTRAEYHRMGEVGILGEDDRVELIRGEIIEMTRPGRRHIAFVNNLNQLLVPSRISSSCGVARCRTRTASRGAMTCCC